MVKDKRLDLRNHTQWDTRDLRRFVLAGLKAELGEWFLTYHVDVRNRRSYSGRGSLGGRWIGLYPSPADNEEASHLYMPGETIIRLAQTLAHEVGHNIGLRHHNMGPATNCPVEWAHRLAADGFRIRHKAPPVPKPKRNLQAERKAHAEKMLAKHEHAFKRTERLVKKWRVKVRYYERASEKRAADKGSR